MLLTPRALLPPILAGALLLAPAALAGPPGLGGHGGGGRGGHSLGGRGLPRPGAVPRPGAGPPRPGGGVSHTSPPHYPASLAATGSHYIYPVPVHGAAVYKSRYGYPIYWWTTTPIIAATVPVVMMGSTTPTSVQASYSPVVSYATPAVSVYATTYAPTSVYAERRGDRYYWAPGAAEATSEVESAIDAASQMAGPTAGGTMISYQMNGSRVYLTDSAPIAGIFEERVGDLHGWIAGVAVPTSAQQQALDTALTAHAQGGSEALAVAASNAGQGE